MKRVIIMLVASMFLMGCAKMDEPYAKAKDTYIVGKNVVEVIPNDPTTEETFTVIDFFASTYDSIRSFIRGEDANVSN